MVMTETQVLEQTNKYKELFSALAKAQSEMPTAGKNTSGYNYKYADLAEIIKISRPSLTKNGLSIIQVLIPGSEDGPALLNTMLCHSSGEYIESKVKIILQADNASKPQNKLQSLGTALTYLRRYSYSAIIGIVTDQDTDGNTSANTSSYQRR